MTTDTKTPVPMSCGHSVQMDLTRMKPFDRKDFVKTKATKGLCFTCDPAKQAEWKKTVAKRDRERTAAQDAQRAQILTDAQTAETRWNLTPVHGTELQVPWATVLRITAITAAWETLDLDEETFAAEIAEPAGQIDSARWWIDHRATEPAELAAEMLEALHDPAVSAGITENPF